MTDTTKHHHGTAANALGGRTARACDSCIRRRARWYCAADDAFLCQLCDSSVHSANPLARRHHRLRLTTTATTAPSWHHGFTRKPRTPRPHSKHPPPKPGPLVPDLDLDTHTDEDQSHLYQVPIFDAQVNCGGFHTSEAELAEFAADVESLLGFDDDGDQFCMERMGIVDEGSCQLADVKMEPGGAGEVGGDGDLETEFSGDGLEIDFDYGSPEKMVDDIEERRLILRLDYDGVIMAWSGRGCSPWSDGRRPEVKIEESWPELMGNWGGGGEGPGPYGELGHVAMAAGDVGREARVTRYREKRRTRLFSKKIRYEVRKLNAEKRPRMKGRFVKRAAFLPATAAAGFSY